MSLRARLVAALVLLMTLGLGVFGGTMYGLYSHSQYDDLRSQLSQSVPLVGVQLARQADVSLPQGFLGTRGQAGRTDGKRPPGGGGHTGGPGYYGHRPGGRGKPPVIVAQGTFGELIGPTGRTLATVEEGKGTSTPHIPSSWLAQKSASYRRVSATSGSSQWLAYLGPRATSGYRVVVAVPTGAVTRALHRLVVIEAIGGASLLLVLSVGAGLVLRRGLSPIEVMASTARRITSGELSQRVEGVPHGTEVGQLASAFNTMLDEIQAAFSQRDATEDRLRQFLADASHELRTPLTSIQGFAELSRLGTDKPHVDQATILRRIEEEAARMRVLVEDLLLLARLDQVRAGERKPVDLAVLAADACSDAVAADPHRPVTLDAAAPVVVLGDRDHLRQALANLVSNALKHTPEGSALEVGARLDQGQAVLAVRDHGAGLDAGALEHAFERFWRRDSARSGTGAGLGLSIVAAVATEHGGRVTAANAPGGGAVFILRLPLALEGERLEAQAQQAA